MAGFPEWMAPPPLPAEPDQADLGGQVYYYVCMSCHGDRGQGLTPEWLAEWGLEKNSCWESKCHASNHPPEGFKLPKTIPAVVGPSVRGRFGTAFDLYTFVKTEMPWHAPGSLSEEEYWQVTAYLVRANGIDPGPLPMDTQRAEVVRLRPQPQPEPASAPPPKTDRLSLWVGGGVLLGFGLLALWWKWAKRPL